MKQLTSILADDKQIECMLTNKKFTIIQMVSGSATDGDIPYAVGHKIYVKERYSPGYEHNNGECREDGRATVEVIYPHSMFQEARIVPATYELADDWDRSYSEDGFEEPIIFPASTMTDNLSRLDLICTDVSIVNDSPDTTTVNNWINSKNMKIIGNPLKSNKKYCVINCEVVHKPADLQSSWVQLWYTKHPDLEWIKLNEEMKD